MAVFRCVLHDLQKFDEFSTSTYLVARRYTRPIFYLKEYSFANTIALMEIVSLSNFYCSESNQKECYHPSLVFTGQIGQKGRERWSQRHCNEKALMWHLILVGWVKKGLGG